MAKATVIRMFPEWGTDVVLWAPWGEVELESLSLDPELARKLSAWGASWEKTLVDDDWPDAASKHAFRAEGRRLGRLLSGEIGDGFEIQVEGRTFRSRHPARNVRVAEILTALAVADEEERERIQQLLDDGAVLEWRAEPP